MSISPRIIPADRRAARTLGVAAAVLFAVSLALFWPGYVAYDSLAQYAQATSGQYEDWHPPIMARLWSLFGDHGPAPMLAVQLGAYWLGLGLFAAALAARGRRRAAWIMLAIGVWPPLLGWQGVVLKDLQMSAALLAATGIVGWWRLRGRRLPGWSFTALVPLFGYALLVRANAPFAVVPLIAMVLPWPMGLARIAVALVGTVAAIGVASPINHGVLGAHRTGVEQTQALYDLVGIGVRSGDAAVGLPVATLDAIRAKRCVRPYFWDPLGEPRRCEALVAPLRAEPAGTLYVRLAGMILRHPLAYAGHRLAHLNSTERLWVPRHWLGAAPLRASEPNTLGFGEPGALARTWQVIGAGLMETPLGWPIVWVVAAIAGLWCALRAQARGRGDDAVAAALFTSALTMEASFAVISIASDLRYHLWTLTATAIGWVLLGPRRWPRAVTLLLVAMVLIGGVARAILPEAPQSYVGMLG
ncbi:hypothetical protein SFC76_07610 [Sphingomonas sp. CD22]|uniref:hypothetical protein n=1 Tax=Sphingomonas sp. CD22 TaxID=3100214 RepID=UPI002ADF4274|nr:hypothetical protein [Sphingomonas sp. CD22]MEA1084127.1 hypothetical protein [Sphingomonas sp. CD22]